MKKILPNLASLAIVGAMSFSVSAYADAYEHFTGTTTSSDRGVSTVTLKDAVGNSGTVAGLAAATGRQIYTDQTETVVNLVSGVDVTVTTVGSGEWMHSYLFIDYDNDGVFTASFDDESTFTVSATSELVSFNKYCGSGSTYYNSIGESSTTGYAKITGPDPALPTFKIPETVEPGQYRARYIVQWNSIDPTGNETDGNGNTIAVNRGEIIDFTIQVVKSEGVVTITEPAAGTGTLQVLNGTENVASGTTLSAGTVLTVVPTPAQDYAIESVTANGTELEAVDGAYSYTLTGDVTFAASFVNTVTFRPAVTFNTPDSTEGTLKVYNGDEELTSGAEVTYGSTLKIVATPAEGYRIASVKANDEALTGTDGTYSYEVTENVSIVAAFTPKAYETASGTASSTYTRGVTTLRVADEDGHSTDIAGNGSASGRNIYVDKTDVTVELSAGSPISVTVPEGTGEWMHSYVYIDYDNNAQFDVALESDGHSLAEGSELVAYNLFSADDGTTYYNSNGEKQETGHTAIQGPSVSIPTFVIPEEYAGRTLRMRYKLDWNSTDPVGGSQIASACGTMMDFMISVVKAAPVVHTIDVAVAAGKDGKEYGSVAIEGSTESSVELTEGGVTVVATPAEGGKFMYWKDADGNTVSTDASYTYTGSKSISLTATFGFEVVAGVSKGGSYVVDDADGSVYQIESGSSAVVEGGRSMYLIISAGDIESGYDIYRTLVNGVETEFEVDDTDTYYEFVVDKPYTFYVQFADPAGVESIAVDANNGEVEFFNLAGARVSNKNLTPGLYIRRSNNKAEKVVIK